MQRATVTFLLAAGLMSGSPALAAADNPVFPVGGLYNVQPVTGANDAPTGNTLGVICLVELGGGARASFNNIWNIVSYNGFNVNRDNHISGNWGVSVTSPSVQTAVIMGNDGETSAAPNNPTVQIGNALVLDEKQPGKWVGLWIRWDNQGNNYVTRVTPVSAGSCTIPH